MEHTRLSLTPFMSNEHASKLRCENLYQPKNINIETRSKENGLQDPTLGTGPTNP